MYITKEIAQEIVEEIGREIQENINLMDEKGCIIASTDASRIGNIHEGAKKIIEEGLPKLYITKEMETATTKMGINLPLVVDGEVTGVVGITGNRERVYGYGNIVRRMTEILIANNIQKDAKRYERRQRYHLLEEWIASNSSYSVDFQKRASAMGINIMNPYRTMILLVKEYQELSDTFDGQNMLEKMEATIRHEADRQKILYLREPSRQICILPWCNSEHMKKVASRFSKLIMQKYGKNLLVGFDSEKEKHLLLKRNVYEAEKAAAQALASYVNIIGYDELGMELFLNEISYSTMEDYIYKLFGNQKEENLQAWIQLIALYFSCEGSISRISERMFIHKNTVQYKITKLEELTNVKLRSPAGAAVYYMAWQFYKFLRQSN